MGLLRKIFRPIKKAAAKLENIMTGGLTNVYGIGEFEPTDPPAVKPVDPAISEAEAAAKIAAEEKAIAKAKALEKAIADEKFRNEAAVKRQEAAAAKVLVAKQLSDKVAANKALADKVAANKATAAEAAASAAATKAAEQLKLQPVTIDTSGKDVPTTASISSKPTIKLKEAKKIKSLIKPAGIDQEQDLMLSSRKGKRQGTRGRRSLLTGFTGAGFYNRFIS
jgi:hypothetical protein